MKTILMSLVMVAVALSEANGQEPLRKHKIGSLEVTVVNLFTNVLGTMPGGSPGSPTQQDPVTLIGTNCFLMVSQTGIHFPKGLDPLLAVSRLVRTNHAQFLDVLSKPPFKVVGQHLGEKHFGVIRMAHWGIESQTVEGTSNIAEGFVLDSENALWRLYWIGPSTNTWRLTNVVVSIKRIEPKFLLPWSGREGRKNDSLRQK